MEDSVVRLGFDRKRVNARPPIVLSLVIGGGILLTLLTSFIVVRRVVGPLDNAAFYGDGKPVDVDWQCDERSVSIRISDRGTGIPAEHNEAVFRPFYRLETARSVHTGGSGLGLAIARQLAIKHGWTIDLIPRQGGGTVARLVLPGFPEQ